MYMENIIKRGRGRPRKVYSYYLKFSYGNFVLYFD